MATTTDLTTLKINYLTQAQYDTALSNNQINANELYLTPSSASSGIGSIGITNATDGGISVSGSPLTSDGSITIGHSNVLSSAQTTQAVYPIKIDKNGHISAYGSAVTIPDVSGKIDTAGTGLSKSGTTLNHSNSVTAQTTQAVYPIKIDAQGHISAYGSAVTILTIGTTSTTAAAGNHTHSYAASSSAGGSATYAATTTDTTNALYPVGVTSSATTTLKRDTSITFTGGTISCSGLTVSSVDHTITSSEYTTIANALDALV